MMYFYRIQEGELDYHDIYDEVIYHEIKFNNKEFAVMYNSVLDKLDKNEEENNIDFRISRSIAKKLCDIYGFKLVEENLSVHNDYSTYDKINLDNIDDDSWCIFV